MNQKKIRILYIISNIDKALAFEWINERLNSELFELEFVLIGKKNTELYNYLKRTNTRVFQLTYSGKKNFIAVFIQVLVIIATRRPAIVHTHLFEANLIGLTSAWLLNIKKRIYTRHHATIHYKEFPSGLKWDKWCNYIATDIVAISNNIKEILIDWDKASPKKIHLIHHGFDFDYFQQVTQAQINHLRLKYNIPVLTRPVIGVISRYMDWKGVQFVIPAFKQLLSEYPSSYLILANAQGNYKKQIQALLFELPQNSYIEIPFEYDLATLYRVFDIFVHVPIDRYSEAFGQIYVESLLSGIPSIFTLSGVACEFIVEGQNALIVDYENSDQILNCMKKLIQDKSLCNSLIKEGKKSINQFLIASYLRKLENLYSAKNA